MSDNKNPVEQWYQRYGASVYRRCYRLLKDHERAQDATQDVFLIAHRKHHQFRGESSPLTWLYRIATRHSLRLLEKEKRYQKTPEEALTPSEAPLLCDALDHKRVLKKILSASSQRDQEILCYLYLDGMTQDEVAQRLGISRRAVVKRLTKWRHRFQKQHKELRT